MTKFMNDGFMLENKTAIQIYENYAKKMPVYDFHCHLDAVDIANDRVYKNITEVWLMHDHYKWRLMRWYGVEEKYITGEASDYEKFEKWAEVISYSIGNPVYMWSHMELKKYFGINYPLNKSNAREVWDEVNKKLASKSVRDMILESDVKVICTTDDPIDSLEHHRAIKDDASFSTIVAPTFRPDKIVNIKETETLNWLKELEKISECQITTVKELTDALSKRMEFFNDLDCRISDHSIENPAFEFTTENEAENIFKDILAKKELSETDSVKFSSYMLLFLGRKYKELDWTMQLHIGALRNNNSRMLKKAGRDSGFDALDDYNYIASLSKYLDALSVDNSLPQTILYCLNPKDYSALSVLSGCFQSEGISGNVQLGAAWWFNDNKVGIKTQLEVLSSTGMLSKSVGMLTDSRSFLSFTRHDYYRRILCTLIGEWVENGEVPYDEQIIKDIVESICFNNADRYFKIGK
ncbi:MAG: glucuronate isomerase [Clostridiales bacterium]|nr:glucuronate isomerase [Clostridiales bacterium]